MRAEDGAGVFGAFHDRFPRQVVWGSNQPKQEGGIVKKLLIALGMVCVTLLAAGCGSSTQTPDQTTQQSGDTGAAGDQSSEGGAQ